jgi:hypothetical protein
VTEKEIDEKIIKFMKEDGLSGHFEFTLPEIVSGTGIAYSVVIKSIERLRANKKIDVRETGRSPRIIPHYYLVELINLFQEKFGESRRKR